MKERPMLFNGAMVRALLAGVKTQTRRGVKLKPWHQIEERDDGSPWPWMHDNDRDADHWLPCPFGQPGQRLWVRETHAPQSDCWGSWGRWARCEGGPGPIIHYAADGGDPFIDKWRPSIHMPRWASRITLEITDVRVERLNSISTQDCWAEGIVSSPDVDPVHEYQDLWESINGAGAWDLNPWVWCVSFKVAA